MIIKFNGIKVHDVTEISFSHNGSIHVYGLKGRRRYLRLTIRKDRWNEVVVIKEKQDSNMLRSSRDSVINIESGK